MRIFGKQVSKWWLLAILPVLVVASPFLLILFFGANNLAGAIVGPPAIWNRPSTSPPRADLVGMYFESKRREDTPSYNPHSSVTLGADGTMEVDGLPSDSCTLSGTGRWTGPDDEQRIDLILVTSKGDCKPGSYSAFELSGHAKPYRLYWVIGDPDSGTGVWLDRKK
jgi:hypothetical protein